MLRNLKTTIGGLIALAAVGLMVFHQLGTQDAMILLGMAAGWMGITGADAKAPDAGQKEETK